MEGNEEGKKKRKRKRFRDFKSSHGEFTSPCIVVKMFNLHFDVGALQQIKSISYCLENLHMQQKCRCVRASFAHRLVVHM